MSGPSWDTPTMAELFFKQGHPERALAIYRKVVQERPNDSQARKRLSELERLTGKEQGAMMNFREQTQAIVEATPGAMACTIMGFDGIAIDTYQVGGAELDLPSLMVEFSAAAQQLKQSAVTQDQAAGLVEMSVSAAKLTTVMRLLSSEYFMAVVLQPGGLTGKARYLMRIAAGQVVNELS